MLGLILSFELLLSESEGLSTGRLTVLRLLMLLLDEFDVDEFDRIVICRPSVLELGAADRVLIGGLDMLLLGVRLVTALPDMLVLGARLVIARLDGLLLGAWLVIALLDVLGLCARLVMALLGLLMLELRLAVTWLGLRLGDTLRELPEEFDLGVALGAGAGLETCRLGWLELPDLLSLDRVFAAKTGSQNNKRANIMQKTRKIEPFRRDSEILTFDL